MNRKREDYLKVIYELGGYENRIKDQEIIERVNIPSQDIKDLKEGLVRDGFISYDKEGIILTDLGIIEARNLFKRRLLWETFLTEKLGYTWEEIDRELENLEHIGSEKLISRLKVFLGYPKSYYNLEDITVNKDSQPRLLIEMNIGEKGKVNRIKKEGTTPSFLAKNEIKIGSIIKMRSFNMGYILVEKEDGELMEIGEEHYKNIYIK